MVQHRIELKYYDQNTKYIESVPKMKKQAVIQHTLMPNITPTENQRKFEIDNKLYYLDSEHRQNYKETQIIKKEKLSATWRKVYTIELNTVFDFVPGDAVSLLVPNDDIIVNKILTMLQYNGSEIIKIQQSKKGNNFTYYGTLYMFFKHIYDLRMNMKKIFLYDLAQVSKCPEELYYLISKAGSVDYFKIISSSYTVIEIIERFQCSVTLDLLLDHTEFIKPRHYSITNLKNENIKLMIGVVYADDKKLIAGHVSHFITRAQLNSTVLCAYKQNRLLNLQEHKNVIMIATGTGIAPFISYVRNSKDRNYWLIYACRREVDDLSLDLNIKKDILYSSKGQNIKLHIDKNIDKIREHVKHDGSIYICANEGMTKYLYDYFKEHLCGMFEKKQIFFDMWK